METYKLVIMSAFALFPFVAFFITLPYFIYNYHKYGSLSKYRMLIVYSFVLYMLVAFFLVLLPLPTFSSVAKMTFNPVQLKPFQAVMDFINKSGFEITNIHTYLGALKSDYFIQPFFNILLTIPFGIYMRYYCKYSIFKTFILSFLLTLTFEVTQLTGLYGIYPRSYRLFDVDDLICNTFGGLIGVLIGSKLKFLKNRDQIDIESYKKSDKITGLRRITAVIVDELFINGVTGCGVILYVLKYNHISIHKAGLIFLIANFIYLVVVPTITKKTLGKVLTNMKIYGNNKESKWYQRLFRTILLFGYIFTLPILMILYIKYESALSDILILFPFYFVVLLISGINLLRGETLWYEKLTRTKNKNTLEVSKYLKSNKKVQEFIKTE